MRAVVSYARRLIQYLHKDSGTVAIAEHTIFSCGRALFAYSTVLPLHKGTNHFYGEILQQLQRQRLAVGIVRGNKYFSPKRTGTMEMHTRGRVCWKMLLLPVVCVCVRAKQ